MTNNYLEILNKQQNKKEGKKSQNQFAHHNKEYSLRYTSSESLNTSRDDENESTHLLSQKRYVT